MRIYKITNDFLTNQIHKNSGDWDDYISVPDVAEILTEEEHEKNNPLCFDFWQYRLFTDNLLQKSSKVQKYTNSNNYINKLYN